MNDVEPAGDGPFAGMSDEQLIVVVRHDDNQDAWSALIALWMKWLPGLIARIARGQLDTEGMVDALQIILVKLTEAARADFDLELCHEPHGGNFRTFAGQVALRALV